MNMIEFLFLIAFSLVLVFTGVSMIGVLLAVAAGFAIMAVAGMIGIVFKLLPWIALIAVVVWFYREKKADKSHRESSTYRRRY
jgi:phage shock protein G